MDVSALRTWLEEHVDSIMAFMDYEATLESEEDLADTLDSWLGSDRWRQSGHRFEHLGIDGTGGQFAAWLRPGAAGPHPVVVFGSEGGRGVLVRSPEHWAKALAHWITVDDFDEPASVSAREPADHDDPVDVEQAKMQVAKYRKTVEAKLGPVPALAELTSGLEKLNDEFLKWVEDHVDH